MKLKQFLAIVIFCAPVSAFSDAISKHDAALGLLDSMNMANAYERMIEQMTEMELQKNPSMMPYKSVLLAFFEKHIGYHNIKEDMAAVYAEEFTTQELLEITKFYETPAGRKTITKMPELMAKGSEIGMRNVQDNLHELQDSIRQEALRLQSLQQNQ